MNHSTLGPIAVSFPERVETAEELYQLHPHWDMPLIRKKTGVDRRYIAAPDECASDLAVRAAERLFEEYGIDRSTIDFLLFCTQSPDYILPTTACVLQHRLGLPKSIGAFDFNLGCSGFVYGLGIADGLIRSGAKRILLLTGETYT
ncbi:MAG: ketoacyl-ACP synthase III, partial [Planctomycetia bacterium]|nr:ketoacyl-ACP synthase III [Planctomycetia bacterium]